MSFKKSNETIALLKSVDFHKTTINKHIEKNKLLKKLCFFRGKIHSLAQLERNNLNFLISKEIELMTNTKELLKKSYDNDYRNRSHTSLLEKEKSTPVCKFYKQEKANLEALSLLNSYSKSKSIFLGLELTLEIQKEIQKLTK